MKKLLFSLTNLILVILLSNQAIAGTGKTLVPFWAGGTSTDQTNLYVSNISQNNVEVTVSVYKSDGTLLNNGVSYYGFVNSNTQLDGKTSGYIAIQPSVWDHGYITIEWKNLGNDDDQVALVALGERYRGPSSKLAVNTITINQGLPF